MKSKACAGGIKIAAAMCNTVSVQSCSVKYMFFLYGTISLLSAGDVCLHFINNQN